MVSKASEDLPEPERPVNTTSLSRGISTSMFLRLCSRAPRMVMARELVAVCWRRAFKISSISEFPGADARDLRAHVPRRGQARNIGRTGGDFQCSVAAINKGDARWQEPAAV